MSIILIPSVLSCETPFEILLTTLYWPDFLVMVQSRSRYEIFLISPGSNGGAMFAQHVTVVAAGLCAGSGSGQVHTGNWLIGIGFGLGVVIFFFRQRRWSWRSLFMAFSIPFAFFMIGGFLVSQCGAAS